MSALRMLAAGLVVAGATFASAAEPLTADVCGMCHEDEVNAFSKGWHGLAMKARSETIFQSSCEGCHGSGEVHIEEGTPESIQRKPDPRACVSCHEDSSIKIELLAATHNRHDVKCLECHDSGHEAGQKTVHAYWGLREEPARLCSSCHQIEAAQFRLPYAHRDGREPIPCVSCHSIHADNRQGRLKLLSPGGACLDCHFEKTQPRVFPHPPDTSPGCASCHRPHGSPNPKLLTRRNIQLLCLECHANTPASHDPTTARYRNCTSCHAAVHGSNRDPRLIEE